MAAGLKVAAEMEKRRHITSRIPGADGYIASAVFDPPPFWLSRCSILAFIPLMKLQISLDILDRDKGK